MTTVIPGGCYVGSGILLSYITTHMALFRALRPIIAICGTTGVGKSRLAVELALNMAKRLDNHGWKGGVVVNADVMQAYKGFNILTNKIPIEERAGVEHVLMDFKEPTEQYVVGQWVHDAIQAVSSSLWFSRALHLNPVHRSILRISRKKYPSSSGGPRTGSSISLFPVGLSLNRSKSLARPQARHCHPILRLPRMGYHLRYHRSHTKCASCLAHSQKYRHRRPRNLMPHFPCTISCMLWTPTLLLGGIGETPERFYVIYRS